MDNIEYFKSSWGDIKNSPGWFGKLCLLALLNLVPVIGPIMVYAYVYGWAREIAWGTHEPMPKHIVSNEDGKFWRRGWFVFVLMFVFMLVPVVLYSIGATMESAQVVMTWFGPQISVDPFLEGLGSLLRLLGMVLAVLMGVLAWVGSIRISIYDRLSAGFQLGKIWKMMRHDGRGIMRIFGMELLMSLLFGFVLSMVIVVLAGFVIAAGVAAFVGSGYSLQSFEYLTQVQQVQVILQVVASAGLVGMLSVLIGSFLASLMGVFIQLLVVRAVGYWTMQFEVPIWGGQDDPMPFELMKEPEPEPVEYPPVVPVSQPAPAQQPMAQQVALAQQVAPVQQAAFAQPDAYGAPGAAGQQGVLPSQGGFSQPGAYAQPSPVGQQGEVFQPQAPAQASAPVAQLAPQPGQGGLMQQPAVEPAEPAVQDEAVSADAPSPYQVQPQVAPEPFVPKVTYEKADAPAGEEGDAGLA